MRYQIISKDYGETPEWKNGKKNADRCLAAVVASATKANSYFLSRVKDEMRSKRLEDCHVLLNFAYCCNHCGSEFWGNIRMPAEDYSSAEAALYDGVKRGYSHVYGDLKIAQEAIEVLKELWQCRYKLNQAAIAEYEEETCSIRDCPICGGKMPPQKGIFMPSYRYFSEKSPGHGEKGMKEFSDDPGSYWNDDSCEKKFSDLSSMREPRDRVQAKEEAAAYTKSCDLFVAENAQAKVSEIKANSEELKKYILHLIHLENNIYALEQQLSELYYQRIPNNRSVVLSVHEPAYMMKAELEELRTAYQKAVEAIGDAKAYQPEVSVNYPEEPAAPVLGKPGLFNKKKVMEENEALTAKYQAAMEAYRKEVQRCDEEKARLIAEERAAVIGEAQAKADTAKAALDEAEGSLDEKIKALEARPVPAKAVKEMLDKEIKEAEELLKKTFAARNELYAYDIIFGKYRNAVALSSFYEYLMSGRCTSLEGADGAYNIYESEVRANRVIAQLDTVISSLEDIKQNQYMMYEELCSINTSLASLNYTMDAALKSIRGIEVNTNHMNEYMEHISQNSDVIAHNTAVTAYYSKVNAQLTNALGYMVAFN